MTALLKPVETPEHAEDARLAALQRYDVLDTPREAAFDRIATLIRLVFGVETSLVTMIDAHRQWYKAAEGTPNIEVPRGESFCRYTIKEDEPVIVPDATQDARFKDNPHVTSPNGVRFYAGMPLRTPDGENIGTICAIDSKPRQFSSHEIEIFKELARVAMSELELRRLATTDGLTGVNTRRAFKEDAQKYVSLARRHRSQLSVIALDIDRFKSINDTYGHASGDTVLRAVAKAVQTELRASDLLGRIGGEEFAIILPDADAKAATAVAEKLRHAVLALKFPGSHPPITVTASFGVATLDPGTDDFDSLLLKADEALYEAKAVGRNVAVTWRGTTSATTKQVERRRVLKAGRLIFNDAFSAIDCTVRSLWETGAEVQVSNTADIPEELTLEIKSSGFKWNAKIVSRRPTSLEVEFV
jgi:diguanylate cyclase (GGDEF)-like protein